MPANPPLSAGVPAKFFQMPGGLAGVLDWKVHVFLGTSRAKIGTWDGIGYIMVNLKDGTIIPTANADAHRTGYEVLWDYWNKQARVRVADYFPVWPYGSNYCYGDEQKPQWETVSKLWHRWGGPELVIQMQPGHGKWSLRSEVENKTVTSSRQAAEGQWGLRDGASLTVFGEQFVELLKVASQRLSVRTISQRSVRAAFDAADAVVTYADKWLSGHFSCIAEEAVLNKCKQALAEARANEDVTAAEHAVFGFGGLKRAIHDRLRALVAEGSGWAFDAATKSLGDLSALVGALSSL
jgi:hypothetical protein